MANNIDGVPIRDLVSATSMSSGDLFPVETAAGTKKVAFQTMQNSMVNLTDSDIQSILKELYP